MTRSTTFACVLTGAILACGLSLASAEASVTWSFYETAITSCNALPVACVLPPQPFVLARLLLPSDTSSGSTTYTGGGPIAQHVSTGDDFSFQVGPDRVVSQTLPPDGPSDCCGGFYSVVDFNISWSETAGILDRVFIDFNSSTDNARIFMDHAISQPTITSAAANSRSAQWPAFGKATFRYPSRCRRRFCSPE